MSRFSEARRVQLREVSCAPPNPSTRSSSSVPHLPVAVVDTSLTRNLNERRMWIDSSLQSPDADSAIWVSAALPNGAATRIDPTDRGELQQRRYGLDQLSLVDRFGQMQLETRGARFLRILLAGVSGQRNRRRRDSCAAQRSH